MRFTRHAKVEIAIVAALLLGSCKAAWEDKLDVADVNGRNAIYRVNALESRVDDLESQISEIESRMNI
jgi:hypothetical protein